MPDVVTASYRKRMDISFEGETEPNPDVDLPMKKVAVCPKMSRNTSPSSLYQNTMLLMRVDNNHAGQRTVQKKRSPIEEPKKIKTPISSRSEFTRWDDLASEENSNSSITSLSEQDCVRDGVSISRSDHNMNELYDGFNQDGFHLKSTQYSQEERLLMKEIEIKVQNERKGVIDNVHHFGEKMREKGNNIPVITDHINRSNVNQWDQFNNNLIDSNEQIAARKSEMHDFSRNERIDNDSRNYDPFSFANRNLQPRHSWDTSDQFCNGWKEQHIPPWLNRQQPLYHVQQNYQFVQKNMTANTYYVNAQQPMSNCHGNNNNWQLPGHGFMIAGQPNYMQPNVGTTEHRSMVTGQQNNITIGIGRQDHNFTDAGQPNNIVPHIGTLRHNSFVAGQPNNMIPNMGASGHNLVVAGQQNLIQRIWRPDHDFVVQGQQDNITTHMNTLGQNFVITGQPNNVTPQLVAPEHNFMVTGQQNDTTQGVGTSEHGFMVTPEMENPLSRDIHGHESNGGKRKNDQQSEYHWSPSVKRGRYFESPDTDLESTQMQERGFITDCTPSHPLCTSNNQNEWNQSYETQEDKSNIKMQQKRFSESERDKPCRENSDVGNKENCKIQQKRVSETQDHRPSQEKSDVQNKEKCEMQLKRISKTQDHRRSQENSDAGNKENCARLLFNNSFQIKECKMPGEKGELEEKKLSASIDQPGHLDAGVTLKQDQRVCANDLNVSNGEKRMTFQELCNGVKHKTFQEPEKRVIDVVKGRYIQHFNQAKPKRAIVRGSEIFSSSTLDIGKLESFGQYPRYSCLDSNIEYIETFATKRLLFDELPESRTKQSYNGLVKDASKFTGFQFKNKSMQLQSMPERLPKWKVAALSDNRCPVSVCLSIPYIKDVKKHAFKVHFPAALKIEGKGKFQAFDHAVIFEVLMQVACVILKDNPSLDGLVRYFNTNTKTNRLPPINITEETAEMRLFCIHRGWPVPTSFTISPINSIAVLTHWRVLLLCIRFMTQEEQIEFKKFVPKPEMLVEQTNKSFVQEMSPIKGSQSSTPAYVNDIKTVHGIDSSKEKPRESNYKDEQLVVPAQNKGSIKTNHAHTKSFNEGRTLNLEKMKDGKTINKKTHKDDANAPAKIKNTLSNRKPRKKCGGCQSE